MLSYRHAFHAGNHADVLKHMVLCAGLQHATRKETPLFYLDTHAGAGQYRLNSVEAERTGEALEGILKLDLQSMLNAVSAQSKQMLESYISTVQPWLLRKQYPGSPLLAASMLRRNDHLHLFELHEAEFSMLQRHMQDDDRVQMTLADGFKNSLALLPPVQKRAVVLIDPPYEIKDDYIRAAELAAKIHGRMPGAQILIWYPVVRRGDVGRLLDKLRHGSIRDLWQFEFGLKPDDEDYGMTASGMLVINPPWTLPDIMRECLPLLQQALTPLQGRWKVENLLAE